MVEMLQEVKALVQTEETLLQMVAGVVDLAAAAVQA